MPLFGLEFVGLFGKSCAERELCRAEELCRAGEDGGNDFFQHGRYKDIYRGLSGNERVGQKVLFFAEDADYASLYVKGENSLFKYSIPYDEFNSYLFSGRIQQLQGSVMDAFGNNLGKGLEYKIIDRTLIDKIVAEILKTQGK